MKHYLTKIGISLMMLALVSVTALTVLAHTRPIHLVEHGTLTPVPNEPGHFTAEGTATATHLGSITVHRTLSLTPSTDGSGLVDVEGEATLVAANGDELRTGIEGTLNPETGHANYSNNNVMAEAHWMVAKARTRFVQYNSRRLSDQEKAGYLDSARIELNEALSLAQKLTDKRRLALVLETSAMNHFLKGNMPAAIEDGKQALKVAAAFPDMKDFPDVYLTLYGAYKSAQDYAKSADSLQKYIAGGNLSADELANRKAEVENLLRKARANGQIK